MDEIHGNVEWELEKMTEKSGQNAQDAQLLRNCLRAANKKARPVQGRHEKTKNDYRPLCGRSIHLVESRRMT